jgi:hypothetical protein
MRKSNRPELDDLSDAQRRAILEGADALGEIGNFMRRSFDRWMTIAKGVAVLRELANQPTASRRAFKNFLRDHGYGSLNRSTASRLVLMAKHETAIRIWRDTLTENKRERWCSPTSICSRCPALRAVIAESAKRKPRKPRTNRQPFHVKRAYDTIFEHLHAIEDADQRAALVDQIKGDLVF